MQRPRMLKRKSELTATSRPPARRHGRAHCSQSSHSPACHSRCGPCARWSLAACASPAGRHASASRTAESAFMYHVYRTPDCSTQMQAPCWLFRRLGPLAGHRQPSLSLNHHFNQPQPRRPASPSSHTTLAHAILRAQLAHSPPRPHPLTPIQHEQAASSPATPGIEQAATRPAALRTKQQNRDCPARTQNSFDKCPARPPVPRAAPGSWCWW